MSKVLIVTGSRTLHDLEHLHRHLEALRHALVNETTTDFAELWHGGARGVDAIAVVYARLCNLPARAWPADWSLGRHAGLIRSTRMIDAAPPDSVIAAFTDKPLCKSRGTAFTVARARGLRVYLVEDYKAGRWLDQQPSLFAR